MRKRLIDNKKNSSPLDDSKINLEAVAELELSSEDPDWPIENALSSDRDSGWRAAAPNAQSIRLGFASPQTIQRIYIHFSEMVWERTQEFVLHWAQNENETPRFIVRQQWNFSPCGATQEIEDFSVFLEDAVLLRLEIIPSINSEGSYASLQKLLLA